MIKLNTNLILKKNKKIKKMNITKKPNGQLKNHVIDKNAHARGHERGCKLGLSFFCFLEEINNLSSTFFF
jgi:hypothetical protein